MSSKKKRRAKEKKKQRKGFHPRLEEHAKASGFRSYASYLASPEWANKRREALERDKGRCSRCNGDTNLQVHHLHYETLGEEKLVSLETLCKGCHEKEHGRNRKKNGKKKNRQRSKLPKRQRRRKPPLAGTPREKGLVPAWERPVADAEWADDLVQRLRDT